jgi:hypothetical protein
MRSVYLALACLILVPFTGCGGSDEQQTDANAAATIGDHVISETDVDRSIDDLFPHEGGYAEAFGPPDYPQCVQAKREAQGSSAAAAKKECRLEFGVIRAQALSYLLRADWARREAERNHLPQPEGGSLRERVDERLDRLQAAVPVSATEIAQYGKDNSMVYADSERRVVEILQTRGRARALRARAELRAGRSWAQVVDRYGTRPLRRTANGRHEIREASAPHHAFGRGMFSAPVGKLVGPVKTLNGQFVFEVQRISHVGSSRLSPKARTTILHTIQSKRLEDHLHERYAPQTTCARRYRVPEVPQCM